MKLPEWPTRGHSIPIGIRWQNIRRPIGIRMPSSEFSYTGAFIPLPAFGSESYPREMYLPGADKGDYQHQVATYGALDKFGYKDFIPQFKAEKFDPQAWAKLFRDAGVKYVVPVAEHHDGFAMYDSDYSDWCAAKMGPKQDVIGELSKAMRGDGITFGLSDHRAEHWWFYGGGRKIPSDVQDEKYRELYGPAQDRAASEAGKTPPDKAFMEDWLLRACEQVDECHPQVVWYSGPWRIKG